jgi:hypothetical protein
MAAHARTIALQILDIIERNPDDPHKIVRYAQGALDAPGMDAIRYPALRLHRGPYGPDLYQGLYFAAEGLINTSLGMGCYGVEPIPDAKRVPYIKRAAERIAELCGHLKHYRSLEAANDAFDRFVKSGRPHYRKRRAIWDAWSVLDINPPQPAEHYR